MELVSALDYAFGDRTSVIGTYKLFRLNLNIAQAVAFQLRASS
jgi:hypothetical protein